MTYGASLPPRAGGDALQPQGLPTFHPSLIGPDESRDGEIIKRMRRPFGRTFRVLAERVRESAFLEV